MNEYELIGDYYEMGRQFATQLQRADRSVQDTAPETLDPPDEKRRFARECGAIVDEHVPELLDELHGIADGTDIEAELVNAVPLALDAEPGCSVVAISGEHTVSGNPLFGRNYDFHTSFREYAKLYHTRPDDGFASVGCASVYVGRSDGINEAGVAIGHAGVAPHEYQPGVVWQLAIRGVLDTCSSVTDAIAFLEEIPHATNVNFLVTDATGDIALIEASPETVTTTRPTDGFGAITNQFFSESMLDRQPHDRVPHDCTRFQTLTDWFKTTDQIAIEDLQQIFADPETGICWRVEDEADPHATLWSWTAAVGSDVGHLAHGSPDETPYKSVPVDR